MEPVGNHHQAGRFDGAVYLILLGSIVRDHARQVFCLIPWPKY